MAYHGGPLTNLLYSEGIEIQYLWYWIVVANGEDKSLNDEEK